MPEVTVNDVNRELLKRVRHELDVRSARTSLTDFIKVTKPDYLFGWFNRELCAVLEQFVQDVIDKKSPRLIISAPPRHGKSEIVSRRFPAWCLGRYPDIEIMNASYSSELASSFNRDVQAIIDTPEFYEIFPECIINGEYAKALGIDGIKNLKKTADFFETIQKGYMFSGGVGGAFTGFGSSIFICDDPLKNREEADSETIREKLWGWYTSTAYTRLSKGGGMIIMNTRWSTEDLTGKLLQAMLEGRGDKYTIFEFPAIATHDEAYRKEGEALHPERYSLEQLQQIKLAVGAKDWASLYQQSPIPDGGGMFKENWIQYYDELPDHFDKIVMAFDMTFKDTKKSDYVAGQVWIKEKGAFYFVDQIRGRFDFVTTVKKFVQFTEKHDYCVRKLIEDKANGTAVINVLKSQIIGIVPIVPKESKEARASAVTTVWEAHNVYIPNPAKYRWVEQEFIPELLAFPGGKHDDQVDCMTMCLNDMIGKSGRIDPTNIELLTRGIL